MAENEILDVGGRRYRRWQRAIADPSVSPWETADCLAVDFEATIRNLLRRNPLLVLLTACKADRAALREAVATFKNRHLAILVTKAFAISRSTDPPVLARHMADILVDSLLDRTRCFALRQNGRADGARFAAIEGATTERLEACKPQVVAWLTASLTNQPIRASRVAKQKQSADAVLRKSLLGAKKKATDALPSI